MPYGKIVVIKRGGGDGTEFPLSSTCLFGRKQDCDIRIQLPHVSKEHCRVELNENKEVILTNMSSVNPTRVNGEELQQAERLKHGDVITIIDRSFRFEYPPQQTPKKSLVSGKADAQVLHEQLRTPGANRSSEISTGPRLKDGANNDNIQRSLEKTMEVESKDEGSVQHSNTDSPFNELYQMIKHSLVTPRKPAGQQPQTTATKNATPRPQPGLITKVVVQAAAAATADVVSTPSKDELKSQVVAKSPKKQTPKRGLSLPAQTPSTLKASEEEVQQVAEKTPTRRKSKTATPVQLIPTEAACATPTAAPVKPSPRVSPRSVEKTLKAHTLKKELEAKAAASELLAAKKREIEAEAAAASPMTMRKRVSFGGHLSPELFDKRLPPSSPLQKGATPRRSLGVARPKQSLLRRASTIGLIKEFDEVKSPKAKSPKAKTPSPAKKASPKVKAASPKKSPKAKSDTPSNDQSPTVKGRFSVSRISTPSPVAELETVTPKLPLKRKSIARKSIARKTPKSALKNVAEVLRRRSGISRASLKVVNSWVDIVKFGQAKPVVAPCKGRPATQKVKKAVVALPMTPARKCPQGHVTTGHADSPVTIVVGKAFNQRFMQHAGAAPKLVQNIALLKKNTKVDQDLTGIAEIFTTPVNSRKRKSDLIAKTSTETPSAALSTSAVDMSVMNTPEESGEMVVSPMGVGSTTKRGTFNREAVQRLLQSEAGSSFTGEAPALDDTAQASCKEVDTKEATPKQKRPQRAVRTPKQKAEPIEDLRGNLLKTPKQKPQQPDGLSAVKRIMKTPRQKTEPTEDLRGKLLKTPRVQKVSGEMSLEGVEQLLETPKRREEPVSVVPEVVVEETPATPEETVTPVEALVVEETPLATPVQTIAPVVEVVEEQTVAPVVEMVEEETIAPVVEQTIAPVVEETIAPVVEEVVEETIAPVVEETIAPVVEETIAPVIEETIAPVVEETIAPVVEEVVEETIAPVVEETIAPVVEVVVEATIAPVVEETIAPVVEEVVEETIAPVVEETIAPVVEETIAPVVEETIAPVIEETIAPVVEETIAPVVEETIAPVAEETIAPVVEETIAPVVEETIAPVVEETIAPVVEETIAPVVEETITPVVEETITPVVEVVVEETIAPVVEMIVEETIAPIVEETIAPVVEETIAPVVEVVVEETITPVVEETIAPVEEETIAPVEEETIAPAVEEMVEEALTTPEENTAELVSSDAPVSLETAPQEVAGQSLPETQLDEKEPEIPAPAPLSKSVRGKKATKLLLDEGPTLEEQTTPAKGRRGRPKKETLTPLKAEEQTPAKSRRGRATGSKNVEAPIVTSLTEEAPEEPSLKPKRGRNAKPAPAAAVVAVPEIAPTEETSDQAPAADAAKSDTTTIPPPATRKGRIPKKVAEQLTAVPQPEEEPVPAVKVEKPRRGRKAAEQEPQVEVIEEVNEVVADQVPPTDAQPEVLAPVTLKARRGRKAVQEAVPEPEAVVTEQASTEEPTQAPVRAKRGRATKAKPEEKVEAEVDIPVVPEAVVKQVSEKLRRTKKTKQEESVEEAAASEELQVVESSVPEKVKAPSKTRGRKGRQEEAEAEEETPVALAVVEEPTAAPAEKPKRGRRPTKAEEPEVVVPPTEEKPKRGGRRTKPEQVVVEEETVEPEQVPEEITELTSSSVAEQPEKVVKATRGKRAAVKAPATAPVKRGRHGATEPPQEEAAAVVEEIAVVVEEIAAVVSRPAARGRAGKRSPVETADVQVEVPAEPATKEAREEEEEKVQPKKGRVSKKTKSTPKDQESSAPVEDEVTVTPEIPAATPVVKATRGRKATVAAASEKAVPVIAAKRNMSRGQSKAEEDLSEVSVPVKRTRRGTKVL